MLGHLGAFSSLSSNRSCKLVTSFFECKTSTHLGLIQIAMQFMKKANLLLSTSRSFLPDSDGSSRVLQMFNSLELESLRLPPKGTT